MSIDVKQLLKVAKQALSNKHNKIAIEKCEVIERIIVSTFIVFTS